VLFRSIADDTCDGIVTITSSVNSVAGVAGTTANAVGGLIRSALALYPQITDYYDISGTDAAIVLTSKLRLANDATLNLKIQNYTCTGITTTNSVNTTAGVASTYASAWTNFDVETADADTIISAIVTATATTTGAGFVIADTSSADFVEITLDDIAMYDLTALEFQNKSLASLKDYFTTFILGTETVKRTFANDIFRVNNMCVVKAGTELDNAGTISLQEMTGGSDYVYAYIAAGKMNSEQLVISVPAGRWYLLESIRASSLLAGGGKVSQIFVETNYNRLAEKLAPIGTWITDQRFSLKDNTVEMEYGLAFPQKSDIIITTSGDATAKLSVEAVGSIC